MRKISLTEQKQILVQILEHIDKVCRDNNIMYSLCGGTLLGAVRHKGFIPWDDDIDILLPRPEYERLITLIKKDQKYLLLSPEDDGYFLPFSKVVDRRTIMRMDNPYEPVIRDLGVFIDIFPIDGLPSKPAEQIKYVEYVRWIRRKMIMSMPRIYYGSNCWWKRLVKRIVYFPWHAYLRLTSSPDKLKAKLLDVMQTYDFNTSPHAGFVLSAYGAREVLPRDIYLGTIELEFEGRKFTAIRNYRVYLNALYGDYMQLPPVEKRVSHHSYTAFWRPGGQPGVGRVREMAGL